MTKEISEEDVRKVVAEVKNPAIDRILVDLGIVKKILTKENKDTIIMAFPFPNITIGDYLVNSVREPIEKVGAEVEVEITVMNQEELERFLAMNRKDEKRVCDSIGRLGSKRRYLFDILN